MDLHMVHVIVQFSIVRLALKALNRAVRKQRNEKRYTQFCVHGTATAK